jgi:pheromone a factor receptor
MSSAGRSATLPVFIRKDTTQKRDSFESFSDVSASYGALSYEKDKTLNSAASFGALSLGDVTGVLPDYTQDDYSDPSSGSSSASSAGSPTRTHTPVPPAAEDEIEVSSLHPASVHTALSRPPMQRTPDVPIPTDAAYVV